MECLGKVVKSEPRERSELNADSGFRASKTSMTIILPPAPCDRHGYYFPTASHRTVKTIFRHFASFIGRERERGSKSPYDGTSRCNVRRICKSLSTWTARIARCLSVGLSKKVKKLMRSLILYTVYRYKGRLRKLGNACSDPRTSLNLIFKYLLYVAESAKRVAVFT